MADDWTTPQDIGATKMKGKIPLSLLCLLQPHHCLAFPYDAIMYNLQFKQRIKRKTQICFKYPDLWMIEEIPTTCLLHLTVESDSCVDEPKLT